MCYIQGLQWLNDISSAVPAVAADILDSCSLQGNVALLSVDLEVVIQQPPERISLALGCRIVDGRPVEGSVLNKRVSPLLYQVPCSKTMPAETDESGAGQYVAKRFLSTRRHKVG